MLVDLLAVRATPSATTATRLVTSLESASRDADLDLAPRSAAVAVVVTPDLALPVTVDGITIAEMTVIDVAVATIAEDVAHVVTAWTTEEAEMTVIDVMTAVVDATKAMRDAEMTEEVATIDAKTLREMKEDAQ